MRGLGTLALGLLDDAADFVRESWDLLLIVVLIALAALHLFVFLAGALP